MVSSFGPGGSPCPGSGPPFGPEAGALSPKPDIGPPDVVPLDIKPPLNQIEFGQPDFEVGENDIQHNLDALSQRKRQIGDSFEQSILDKQATELYDFDRASPPLKIDNIDKSIPFKGYEIEIKEPKDIQDAVDALTKNTEERLKPEEQAERKLIDFGVGENDIQHNLDALSQRKRQIGDSFEQSILDKRATEPYDFDRASPPPKIDNIDKSIPFKGYEIEIKDPPSELLELPPHIPTFPEIPTKTESDKFVEAAKSNEPKDIQETMDAVTKNTEKCFQPEEQAERKLIYHPQDGVGCRFGDAEPAPGEMDRYLQSLSNSEYLKLFAGDSKIVIRGYASNPGSDAYNQELSEERAVNVKDFLVNKGVDPSRIEIISLGEKGADLSGSENQDNHQDRWVEIEIEKSENSKKDMPRIREIPSKYTGDYKYDRDWAENPWRLAWEKIKQMPIPTSLNPWKATTAFGRKLIMGAATQINDAPRWREELESTTNVHDKLWKVKPPKGFIFDRNKTSVRIMVESWLKEGGYDVKTMVNEYFLHWLRKGAK